MSRSLRRSSRLKDKAAPIYVDTLSEDSEFPDESDYEVSSSESVYAPSDTDDNTYCICGETENERMMICCDRCNIWYHYDCAKLTLSTAKRLSKSKKKWFCPSCSSKEKRNKKSTAKKRTTSNTTKRSTSNTRKSTKTKQSRKRKRQEIEQNDNLSHSVTGNNNNENINNTNDDANCSSHSYPLRSKRRRVCRIPVITTKSFLSSSPSTLSSVVPIQMSQRTQVSQQTNALNESDSNTVNTINTQNVANPSTSTPHHAIRNLFAKCMNTLTPNSNSTPKGPSSIPGAHCNAVIITEIQSFELPFAPSPDPEIEQNDDIQSTPSPEIGNRINPLNRSIPNATDSITSMIPMHSVISVPAPPSTSITNENRGTISTDPITGARNHRNLTNSVTEELSQSTATGDDVNEINEQTDSDLEILTAHQPTLGPKSGQCAVMEVVTEEAVDIRKPLMLTSLTMECKADDVIPTKGGNDGDSTECDESNESGDDTSDSDSDSDIEIQAGDRWVGSSTFLKNKETMKEEIREKKRETLRHLTEDLEEESSEDDGTDFMVLNANKTSKNEVCPLTLTKIKQPIRNMLCPHVYERSAIKGYKQYLSTKNKPQKCPQGGCQALLVVTC